MVHSLRDFLLELSYSNIFVDLFHDYKHAKIFWSLIDQSGCKRSFTGLLRMPVMRKFWNLSVSWTAKFFIK